MYTSTDIDSESSSNMLKACRTCLKLIDVDNLPFYEVEADDVQLSTESCHYKLLSIVPEMKLTITPKMVICGACHENVEALFEFKAKCLKTEDIIIQYLKAKPDVDIKNFDLKDVLAFNGVDMQYMEDVASIQHVTVKEEEKSSDIAEFVPVDESNGFDTKNTEDQEHVNVKKELESSEEFVATEETITIVKHEVDDYLPESFEFVDPDNKVLESEKFVRQENLTAHQKKSFNIKKLECEYCKKSFDQRFKLINHLYMHTGEKPHHCEICDKRFRIKYYLTIHMRTHTGEKPYKCEICGRKFSRQEHWSEHQRTHSGAKNFECAQCKKRFKEKYNLRLHLALHTKEQSFSCDFCKKVFYHKTGVRAHIRRMHKDVDINTIVIEEIKREKTEVIEEVKREKTE